MMALERGVRISWGPDHLGEKIGFLPKDACSALAALGVGQIFSLRAFFIA